MTDWSDAVPLAGLTTFGVGGPAARLLVATTEDELTAAVRGADEQREPLFVLSGGSNVLISDDGFDGRVVRVATRGVSGHTTSDDAAPSVIWDVAAGEPLDGIVEASVGEGLSGLEALSGIPGLAGAAPVQNVGAYGAEIATSVDSVRVWDRLTGETRVMTSAECGFGYRDSVFKRSRESGQATGRYVVLGLSMRLVRDRLSAPVAYAELARTLGVAIGRRVPLADVRQAVLELRRGKGMVIDPADPDTRSAGSFFTNPILDAARAAALPPDAPRFPQPDGAIKSSAAWLIEHAGFPKGFGSGPARLSSKHALALTNQGGAAAADIVALAREIRAGVESRFGVTLQPEPVLVGVEL